MTADVARTER